MDSVSFFDHLRKQMDDIRAEGLYKAERVIDSPQSAEILVGGDVVLNFCANNYLGLANHPELIAAAKTGLDARGFGLASVRFICGTQDIHKRLEAELSEFLGTEDTILFSSCFDANGGLFEALLGEEDAVVSDALNHASIIDGIRLCKAKRYRYANNDMADLDAQLVQAEADGARFKMIATDGVFSMDGVIADLAAIREIADRRGALVMVDDSHAVGFIGENGGGTPEYRGVRGRIDIITGTLGKAMGGASGGYVSGKREIIDWLRQRSRPYLFSNSLPPPMVAAAIATLDLLRRSGDPRKRLRRNAARFRERMEAAGFLLAGKDHPIIPVMLGDAAVAAEMASRLLAEGIYVVGFSYPVVPKGKARIRVQISAVHTEAQIDRAVDAFAKIGTEMGLISGRSAR